MREIKFRAWDKTRDTPCMVEWSELKPFTCQDVFMQLNEVVVMQFTGLTDKNGKEIYEGDIIKDFGYSAKFEPGTAKGVIIWSDKWGGWQIEWHGVLKLEWQKEHKSDTLHDSLNSFSADSFEVIGNLYQTPELLKEAKG